MNFSTLLLYIIACSAVTALPGPTMLLALTNGARSGMRTAAFGMAGAALSDLILIAIVGCGLGAALMASDALFTTIKWIGAAYLLVLTWKLWRAPAGSIKIESVEWSPDRPDRPNSAEARISIAAHTGAKPDQRRARSAFVRSLLVSLTNPKGLMFFSSFLPQFIHPKALLLPQYASLALITAAIDIAFMTLYALGGYNVVKWLSHRALLWLNRGCAMTLASLAVALSLSRRSGAS